MRMILYESLVLSAVGAVLGIVTAVLLTRLLSAIPQGSQYLEGRIAPMVMLRGFLIALAVGLVGGLYPALRGARLLPTEAIRHE
jgi:putative ABC transport system permease protein